MGGLGGAAFSQNINHKIADGAGASQVLSLDTIYQLNDLIYMVRHGMHHVRAADTLNEKIYRFYFWMKIKIKNL